MKILITGHKGLIGSALFNSLKKHDLTGFDRGDTFPDEHFDLIIHTAANCVIRETIRLPELSKENIDLTFAVFELARKYKSNVIAFSSGRLNHDSFNPYTVSKRYLEDIAIAYKDCYNIDTLVIRPETVWGKSNNNERVVIKWLQAALKGEPLLFYGNPEKELPPIYIDEFNKAVLHVLKDFDAFKNQVVTISGQIRKATDIAQAIINLTGSGSEIVFMNPEITQPQTCEKAMFTSKVSFEDSMRKFIINY